MLMPNICSVNVHVLVSGRSCGPSQYACIHSLFITEIYIAPVQGYYSEALPTLARLKRRVLYLW